MAWEKQVSQSEAVKSFLVVVDGKVNIGASVEKFQNAALRYMASRESEDELIVTSVNALFDQYRGAVLGMEFIKSQTVQRMAKVSPELGQPTVFSMVSARVEQVMDALTDREERPSKGDKPAVDAITNRAFAVKRGKGGGTYRKSDQAVKSA